MIRRAILLTATMLAAMSPFALSAQRLQEFGFAYYDVDRLYDTVPSLFYDDSAWTPEGRLGWTSERYERKVARIAAVLDSMRMPVVALRGVENEAVVRDIAARCEQEYSFIHRTLDTSDGLDFALLYYADVLFPQRTVADRNGLTIFAEVGAVDCAFVLLRRGAWMEEAVEGIRRREPARMVIVAGDAEPAACDRCGVMDVTAAAERAGRGNMNRGGWRFADRIAVDVRAEAAGDVYVDRTLVDRRGAPVATFEGVRYTGGAGRRLPVRCVIRQKIE